MEIVDDKGVSMATLTAPRSFRPMRIVLGKAGMPVLDDFRFGSRPRKGGYRKGGGRDRRQDQECRGEPDGGTEPSGQRIGD